MDPIFIVLCLVPVVAGVIQFILLPHSFTWKEAVIQVLLCTLLVVICWNVLRYSSAQDVEIWNGTVSAKEAIRKNCPSGWVNSTDSHCTNYSTRSIQTGETCVEDSEGKRVCTPIYTTQYNYDYAWERRYWVVAKNIDLRLEYRRVDPQGVHQPPLYAAISVGDPAAKTVSYMNWVKGAADSLFHEDGAIEEKYDGLIPGYPIEIYDGIKVDRVISVGVSIPTRRWSMDLSRSLSELGPARQMNAAVVLIDAGQADEDYAFAVRRAWRGFKKNDAVVVIGLGPALDVRWVRAMSWSSSSAFDIGVQNELLALRGQPLTSEALNAALIKHGMASYVRRSMTEFEFLKESIPVPGWLYALVALLSIGGTAGLSAFFHRIDI